MSLLINKTLMKRVLLERAKKLRPFHSFTRVSDETYIFLDNQLRRAADAFIASHPAKGQTLKP